METVGVVAAAVKPIIQEKISQHSVTAVSTSQAVIRASRHQAETVLEESSWLWRDHRILWLIGGAAVGFYFGFRLGVVSGR